MRSKILHVTLLAALAILIATGAAAQQLSAGVRVGASVDPDQFYFGGHVETRALVDRVHFRPNVEIGIGDNVTLVALNFELAYKFPSRRPWNAYALAGPALNLFSFRGNTESAGGFSLGMGIEHREGLFGEIKAGMIDSPDFKIGIGYRFR